MALVRHAAAPRATAARPEVPATLRAAGVLSVLLGLTFGIAMAISLERLARDEPLPMTPFGFRAFAGGPFDQLPRTAFAALGWALLVSCVLDVLAGVALWLGRRRGAQLAAVTTPVSVALGIGFALPFLLIGIPLRAALIVLGRKGLR